jgi:hypothetical protein
MWVGTFVGGGCPNQTTRAHGDAAALAELLATIEKRPAAA